MAPGSFAIELAELPDMQEPRSAPRFTLAAQRPQALRLGVTGGHLQRPDDRVSGVRLAVLGQVCDQLRVVAARRLHQRQQRRYPAEVVERRQNARARRGSLTHVQSVDHRNARALAHQCVGDARAHETPADDGYVDHGSPGINPSGVYRAVPEMTTAAAKALARGVMAGGSDLAGRRRGATMKR